MYNVRCVGIADLKKVQYTQCTMYNTTRVAEVDVLAETAKYPSMLARSARLQIFATKNIVFYNCKFLQQKRRFTIASVCSPALALPALR